MKIPMTKPIVAALALAAGAVLPSCMDPHHGHDRHVDNNPHRGVDGRDDDRRDHRDYDSRKHDRAASDKKLPASKPGSENWTSKRE